MTAHSAPLPDVEWNFDCVPNDELAACCYWEYARESSLIQSTSKRLRECGGEVASDDAGGELREDVDAIRSIGRFGWMLLDSQCDLASPWQALSRAQRTVLIETTCSRRQPFSWEYWDQIAKMLHESASEYSSNKEIRVIVRVPTWGIPCPGRRSRKKNRAAKKVTHQEMKPCVRWADKADTVMMTIAWGDYTNDQLAVKFRRWLKENRPKDIPQPDKRGEQFRHWRTALRRLGIMRLNYHCTRHRLRSWHKPAWERFRDSYKEWYGAPREAEKCFRKLFPFLDPMEDLIHLRPKRKGKLLIA